jgi:butyryl-CoA dehydrogenase
LILPILTYGTEEQKKRWLPRIAAGDAFCAFALTEPEAGSDVTAMTTRAAKQGDFYVLNGRKSFISGAKSANLFLIFAVTNPSGAAKKEITAFILDTEENAEGMTVGQKESTMGMLGAPVYDIYFADVRIPEKNILGKPGEGFKAAMIGLNPGRCALSALALGIAQRAVDVTVEYVKERKMFGKTLSAFQNTQFVLAEAQTKVNASRLMIHQAAVTLDQGGNAAQMCAEAKWFATETAKSVVDNCLQFFGGYGYIKGFPIEQMYRDVRVFTIFEGATEVQKHTIAKFMGLR